MKFINDYWKIITTVVVVILSIGTLYGQVAQNSKDIERNFTSTSKSNVSIVLQIKAEAEELKKAAEKQYAEAKKERQALESEQKKTTVLEVKQDYIIKSMGDMNAVLKDLANEIRASERRRK